jgi:hypothetical protein
MNPTVLLEKVHELRLEGLATEFFTPSKHTKSSSEKTGERIAQKNTSTRSTKEVNLVR